jgi:hypothetical protein
MNYEVGQLVICTTRKNWIGQGGSKTYGPLFGCVCEIEAIVLHDDDGEYLVFKEYTRLGMSGKRPSFPSTAFKPVSHRDISVFNDALLGSLEQKTQRLNLLLTERNPLDFKRKRTRK